MGNALRRAPSRRMIGQLWHWLRQQINVHRRRLDTEVLWPQVLHQARGDLRAARNAFRLHISLDPAWRDLEENERDRIIAGCTEQRASVALAADRRRAILRLPLPNFALPPAALRPAL